VLVDDSTRRADPSLDGSAAVRAACAPGVEPAVAPIGRASLGPSQIRNPLRRRGLEVAVATVRRVMEVAGYRPPKVQRDPHEQRYDAVRPSHLWHLDSCTGTSTGRTRSR
jgi:hypothetical protein